MENHHLITNTVAIVPGKNHQHMQKLLDEKYHEEWYIYVVLKYPSGEGDGTPLQHSCLENPMDRGARWAAVHWVAKSQIRLSDFTLMHWRRKWQPTPVFLPGESQGWGSLVGCHLWGRAESDTTEET